MQFSVYRVLREELKQHASSFKGERMVNPTKDGVTKDLLGNNENFASVFNYFLYKGEKRIRPGRLHDVHIEHRFFFRG